MELQTTTTNLTTAANEALDLVFDLKMSYRRIIAMMDELKARYDEAVANETTVDTEVSDQEFAERVYGEHYRTLVLALNDVAEGVEELYAICGRVGVALHSSPVMPDEGLDAYLRKVAS
jgi:hypothetical protein